MDNQNLTAHIQEAGRKKGLFSALLVVLIIFLVVISIFTAISALNKFKQWKEPSSSRTISFTETGEIYAKPDLAIVNFSVITEKKTVAEAMAENTEKMNSVINSIKSQGVDSKDLKTTGFNIYPRYEYTKEQIEIYPYPPGKRVLVGYEISQRLEVKIRDLAMTGKIIETATAAGANEVGDLLFTIDKEDEFKAQARKQAIDKAKAKAKELANQLGIKLVRISNFLDTETLPVFYNRYEEAMGTSGQKPVPVPQIETGENKISVTVTITYEIN